MVSLKDMLYYRLEQPFDVFDVKELKEFGTFCLGGQRSNNKAWKGKQYIFLSYRVA